MFQIQRGDKSPGVGDLDRVKYGNIETFSVHSFSIRQVGKTLFIMDIFVTKWCI